MLGGADLDRASLDGCRLHGATLDGARGAIHGPVDIGEGDEPRLLDGDELLAWLREHGAPELTPR